MGRESVVLQHTLARTVDTTSKEMPRDTQRAIRERGTVTIEWLEIGREQSKKIMLSQMQRKEREHVRTNMSKAVLYIGSTTEQKELCPKISGVQSRLSALRKVTLMTLTLLCAQNEECEESK